MSKTKKQTPRCTAQEKIKRLLHVEDLLADGLGIAEIVRNDVVITWGIDRVMVGKYIADAWADIHEFRKEELATKIDRAVIERNRIKLRAAKIGDYGAALKAMDGRDKIEGILKDHVAISGGVDLVEIRKRLEKSREDGADKDGT